MLPKIQKMNYEGKFLVWVKFEDGVQGLINLEEDLWGEVFEPLKDENKFAQVSLDPELGTIVWPNGADFAPEYLYKKLCPEYVIKPSSMSSVAEKNPEK